MQQNRRQNTTQKTTPNMYRTRERYGNASNGKAACKICRGTGYAVEDIIVPDYDPITPVHMGSPCPVCKGRADLGNPGFPSIYSEADMSKFDFAFYGGAADFTKQVATKFWQQYPKWELRNKGLYIWSKTKGSGKTFLACCLAGSVQVKYRKMVKFVSAVEYLQAVKESFKQGPEVPNQIFGYMNCDLLVLDDLGSEKQSEWADQELFRLIDHRMCEEKPVIITSNVSVEALKCDGRISDRLTDMCIAVPMPEISIRRRRAKASNDRFLEEILGA